MNEADKAGGAGAPKPELLAPAGQPDAGYAALHYGADAVYLGLDRFSARAEAVNFTPDQLAEFAAYAHSLTPRRQVYLTLNTLIKQSELAGAAETLLVAAECGVDAVIVQDLGVARVARERFPGLRLHASTQMAIHNLEGALAARDLGYSRVTMARELTLDELRRVAGESGLEVEAFIHGTLCYSYSGLCLYSSMVTGRSGNRGRCVYTCREAADTPHGRTHPFSLKDMALGERVLDLARASVASLKIEGRKKSPLYVAATVDYYRRLLDGRMTPEDAAATEARLRTIFARPWTRLFLDGKHNPRAADPDVVGHRGSRIGTVERLVRTPAGPGIRFTPSMAVERHDGLQIDVPGQAKPYGFPVDNLFRVGGKRPLSVFAGEAGEPLAVALPADAPPLEPGLPLYLSSSQAVKRSYPFSRPKPGMYGLRRSVDIVVTMKRASDAVGEEQTGKITCEAVMEPPAFLAGFSERVRSARMVWNHEELVPAFPARDAAGAGEAALAAFRRTGSGGLVVRGWRFENPDALFVRPGEWNRIRRTMTGELDARYADLLAAAGRELAAFCNSVPAATSADAATPDSSDPLWSLCVEQPSHLAAFGEEDFTAADEVGVVLPYDDMEDWRRELDRLAERVGNDRVRLIVPLVLRGDMTAAMSENMAELYRSGWRRWMVSGLGGWRLLAGFGDADVTADWPLYVMNGQAAARLAEMGLERFTLSPEDDAENLRALLSRHGDRSIVVAYSDLPLFISAACGHSHMGLCRTGGKPGAPCRKPGPTDGMRIRMERSGDAIIWPTACGSVVTGQPFSLAGKIDTLRAMGATRFRVDLRWKPRTPEEAADIWRNLRNQLEKVPGYGNFDRGLS